MEAQEKSACNKNPRQCIPPLKQGDMPDPPLYHSTAHPALEIALETWLNSM